jgi:hypothetical protein
MFHRLIGVTALILSPAVATAATPNPDRPSYSQTGVLIAPSSVELEGGLIWSQGGAGAAFLPKVGLGRFEPRVGVAVLNSGTLITPGVKIGVVQKEGLGVAGHVHVAVPAESGVGTTGVVGALATGTLAGGQVLQANLDMRTYITSGGAQIMDTPLSALVGLPVGKRLSAFGEVVLAFNGGGETPVFLDGGVGFALTKSVSLDAGLGWQTGGDTITATAGATANFGSFK